MPSENKRAFTLIELLVVIAIIGVLGALLLPALSMAKARGHSVACLNHLKQIGFAARMYGDDNQDEIPGSSHAANSWLVTLRPYLENTNLYRCPKDPNATRRYSYAINDFLITKPSGSGSRGFSRSTSIPDASATLFMAETHPDHTDSDHFHFARSEDGGYEANAFALQVDPKRHGGSANYLFVDGHVQILPWAVVRGRLREVGSPFVKPDGHQSGQQP